MAPSAIEQKIATALSAKTTAAGSALAEYEADEAGYAAEDAARAAALEGQVLSVWRRDAERNCDNPKAAELCCGVFHRERIPASAGPVRVDENGIAGSASTRAISCHDLIDFQRGRF